MDEKAIPPGKKKPYPVRHAPIFYLHEHETGYRNLDRKPCWNCGCKKQTSGEVETVFVLNNKQVVVNLLVYQCTECGLPEAGRCSFDWKGEAYVFLGMNHRPYFRGPYAQKWDRRKKKLEAEIAKTERELVQMKIRLERVKKGEVT